MNKRGKAALFSRLINFSPEDLDYVSNFLPCLVGDLHYETKKFASAVDKLLAGRDLKKAIDATSDALADFLHSRNEGGILQIYSCWRKNKWAEEKIPERSRVHVFLQLFKDPALAAKCFKSFCMRDLNIELIKFAVRHHSLDATLLYEFDSDAFLEDVMCSLKKQMKPMDIIYWFHERRDASHATSFFASRIQQWTDDEFLELVGDLRLRPSQVFNESDRRKLHLLSVNLYLEVDKLKEALTYSNLLLDSFKDAGKNGEALFALWRPKWEKVEKLREKEKKTIDSDQIGLLMILFNKPEDQAKDPEKRVNCMKKLGGALVHKAVMQYPFKSDTAKLRVLYQFDRKVFQPIVLQHLHKIHKNSPVEIVKWLQDNNNIATAKLISQKGLKHVIHVNPLKQMFTNHENLTFFLTEEIISSDEILLKQDSSLETEIEQVSKCIHKSQVAFECIIGKLQAKHFTKWLRVNSNQNLRLLIRGNYLVVDISEDERAQVDKTTASTPENCVINWFDSKCDNEKESLGEKFLAQMREKLNSYFRWFDAFTKSASFFLKGGLLSSADIDAALFSTSQKKTCSTSAPDLKKSDGLSKPVSVAISKGENKTVSREDNKSGISKGFLLNQKEGRGGGELKSKRGEKNRGNK